MAFNMQDSRVIPYPRGAEISKDALFTWLDGVFKGEINIKTDNFAREIVDKEITPFLLNNTIIATR